MMLYLNYQINIGHYPRGCRKLKEDSSLCNLIFQPHMLQD